MRTAPALAATIARASVGCSLVGVLSAGSLHSLGALQLTDPVVIPHHEGGRLLLEIPRRTLETDLLVTCRVDAVHPLPANVRRTICLADTSTDISDAAVSETRSYWHFTRVGRVILVRLHDAQLVPIARVGPDSAPVIDVTSLLPHGLVGPTPIVRTTLQPHGLVVELAPRVGAERVTVHWTLLQLPNRPIPTGRAPYADSLPVTNGGIRRLEKRDPWAVSSEVVTPIVYTLDPATPPQWIRFIRRGLEEWNPVFDAIGFQHVIQIRELQGPHRAARWRALLASPHDVVIWETDYQGGKGEGGRTAITENGRPDAVLVHAPIHLNAHWIVDRWAPDNLTASAAVFDPLVQRQPTGWDTHCPKTCLLPDSLVGLFLQWTVAHEMGHALGLNHNFTARLAYPTDSLHRATFLARMGYTPTVMDYADINYVAQPDDHLPAEDLIHWVGPYDRWAIAWLYRPIPGAYTLADELPVLQRWSTAQDTAPYLRGSADDDFNQPMIGADAVSSAEAHVQLLADLVMRFGTPASQWPLKLWRAWMKEAGTKRDFSDDSAHVVPLVHFYLTHLALRHDPVLHAVGLTAGETTTVSMGRNRQAWETAVDNLLTAVLTVVDELLRSHPTGHVQQGVCHLVHSVRDTLANQGRTGSLAALGYTDSLCAHPVTVARKDKAPLQASPVPSKDPLMRVVPPAGVIAVNRLPTHPNTLAEGDGEPLLTAAVLARLGMVQARVTQLPDSIATTGLAAAETTLVVHLGTRRDTATGIAMERFAARYPGVAAVLRQSGMTTLQWTIYQTAVVQVCWALHLGLTDSLPLGSTLGCNLAYGYGHRNQLRALIAAGMPLPAPRSKVEEQVEIGKQWQKMLGGQMP